MITQLPSIMTKNGQKLRILFTSIEIYTEEGNIKFDLEFYDFNNNYHAGTIACIINVYHLQNRLKIDLKSIDAFPIGKGIGTSMLYSFFRWIYFSYPGYEFHFNGVLNTAFDQEYLIAFYKKIGFTVTNGRFYRVIQREESTNFCLDIEKRISYIYSDFIEKQKTYYDQSIDQAQKNLLNLEQRLNKMSIIDFIKLRYLY